jgi:predicted Zn-dependent peptidase
MILTLISLAFGESPMTVHTWTLDNNDIVILVEDHRVPIALVNTRFPIGSYSPWFEENHGEEAFDILYYDENQSLMERTNTLAADVNVGCGSYGCKSSIKLLKEDLEDGLQLYKDLLGNTSLDVEQLSRWKKSQKIDWESELKEPSFIGRRALLTALYPDTDDIRHQRYLKPDPIHEDTDDLRTTVHHIQRTPNRIIGFAGDITKSEAEQMLGDLLPASEAPIDERKPKFSSPLSIEDGRKATQSETMPNLTQVYFYYYRDAISYDNSNYPAYLIADHILGGHFYSRLYQALRHDDGDTYGVSTVEIMYPHNKGAYSIETFTRTENKEVVSEKLKSVLLSYYTDGISQEELNEAQSHLVGQNKSNKQSPMSVLGGLAVNELYGLDQNFDDTAVQQASELDLETVNAFIKEFYNPEQFSLLEVINEE